MELTLKKLDACEVETVKTMLKEIFSKAPWFDDWSDEEQLRAYVVDLIGNTSSLTFGLCDGDKLVGICTGRIRHWYAGTQYCIDDLGIATERQRSGLGGVFLKMIGDELKQSGIKSIVLYTDRETPAYHFYKGLGFTEDVNHVCYQKMLD